jgi:ABC-2 type transport system ATP-binding protein
MNLVERLADRVLLMNRGKEVLQGTIAQVKDRARSTHKVIITLDETADISLFRDIPAVLDIEQQTDRTLAFHLKKGESINQFLAAVSAKVNISAIHSEQISLHEVFVQSVKADSEDSSAEGVI